MQIKVMKSLNQKKRAKWGEKGKTAAAAFGQPPMMKPTIIKIVQTAAS